MVPCPVGWAAGACKMTGSLLLSIVSQGLADRGAEIAGSILLVLAIALFVAEVLAPTHGSIAAGGLVILVVGLVLLARATGSATPILLIIALVVVLALFAGMVIFEIAMARHRPVTTGASGLENEIGIVRTPLTPVGTVFIHGELWRATAANGETLPAETPVRVVAVDDLTLVVQYAAETAITLPPAPGAFDTLPTQRSHP